jgi:hypothetical protein
MDKIKAILAACLFLIMGQATFFKVSEEKSPPLAIMTSNSQCFPLKLGFLL